MRLHSAVLSLLITAALSPGVFLVAASPAAAQTWTGSISGTVVSDQGPIRDATIRVTGPALRSVSSGANGAFAVPGLPDGTYYLTIAHPGFAAVTDTKVVISGGLPQTLSVTLVAQTLSSLRTIGSTATTGGRSSTALNTTAAAQVTVTSQQFLDRGETQVVDILEEQPGVEITRVDSGALGSNADIALRGANPYETQVLIDGHPVNGGRFGEYLVQFLNPIILGSVEVDKGPGAFGNLIEDAVGGRVNFRTPSITSTATGSFLVGYDTFNGSMYGARFSDTIGKFGFLVAYAFDGTPGYFANQPIYVVDPQNQFVQGKPPPLAVIDQAVQSSETYQNRSQLFKLAYTFSTTTSLQAGFYGSQSYVDYSGTLGTVEPYTIVAQCPVPGAATGTLGAIPCEGGGLYTNPKNGNLIGSTILAADSPDGDNVFQGNTDTDSEPIFTADVRTAFGGGTFLGRFYAGSITRVITDPGEVNQITACTNPSCSTFTTDGKDFTEDESDELHGYDFEYDLPVGLSTLTASYDTHNDRTGFFETGEPADLIGLLLKSQTFTLRGIFPLTPRLQLGVANYFSDTTFVGKHYDPAAYLVWEPNRRQSIRVSGGTAFVTPPSSFVTKVAGASGSDTGAALIAPGELGVTDNLKPEFSTSYDLGTDYRTGLDSKVTLDLYNTIVDNRFSTDTIRFINGATATFDGQPIDEIEELFNQSDSNEEGIEIGFLKTPRVGFGGSLAWDFLRAYDFGTTPIVLPSYATLSAAQTGAVTGAADEANGFQIPGYPYSHGHAELNYRFASGARLALGMTYYGDYNSFGETAFELFDAHVGLPLAHGFSLLLSGTNLFNHDDGRALGEFENGEYVPPAAKGETESPVGLFFAPPRRLTLQLTHPL